MARIEVYLDATAKAPLIHDRPEGPGSDRSHVYVTFTDRDGSEVTFHPAYPLGSDEDVASVLDLFISTFEQMRNSALGRIHDRAWIAAAKYSRYDPEQGAHDPVPDIALADPGDHHVGMPA